MDHKELTYNPLQLETAKYLEEDCNIVCLSPTSSGKTIVAEQYIAPVLQAGQRAIYLSPLKALTNEKLENWSLKLQPSGASLQAVTGDHHNVATPITSDLVLMTTEALDSKTRGMQQWLKKAGVVVSDESHLLASPKRGDAFEVGLVRFAQINPDARLIFLSATIPNAQELADWLTVLNGKPTQVVHTDWRPVEQEYHLHYLPEKPWEFNEEAVSEIVKIQKNYPDSQILIFVHTVAMGNRISKCLKCPFHYSKIEKDKRHRVEDGFRNGSIRTLVATSTLAYGLNLPADVGVIVGAYRGPMRVDATDLKQEAGRIGRYGLSERGYIHFLFPSDTADTLYDEVLQTPDIQSVLPDRLYFHITSFIAREYMQREKIFSFLQKTLASRQTTLWIEEAIKLLCQYDIIYDESSGLRPSPVGRGAALLYLDPIDLYFWRENFSNRPMTPTAIAMAYAMVPSNYVHTFVPRDLKDQIDLGYGQATLIATCLRDWLAGKPMEGLLTVIVPPIIKDIDRLLSGLKVAGMDKSYLDMLSLLIKNGVHPQVIDLISLKGVGRKRAFSLYEKGITSQQDILDNPKLASNILGAKTYRQVEAEISAPGKTYLNF